MSCIWTVLAGQPVASSGWPSFPSPFDELGPSPLAARAAAVLMDEFRGGLIAHDVPASILDLPAGGKMFGVLVARDASGCLGFLRAFSGTLNGTFDVAGYAPPIFDGEAREAIEPVGTQIVFEMTERARAFAVSPELARARWTALELLEQQRGELEAVVSQHANNREQRRARRGELERLQPPVAEAALQELLHALAQQSRGDKAERRRLDAAHAESLRVVEADLARLERRLRAHECLHGMHSRRLMKQIHDTYRVTSARGETRPLRDLYAPGEPPGGAGDCAAPKLLAYAYANDLQPLAMAEFWWGDPPPGGGRVTGAFYPACRDKCGPLLPFLLEGLDVAQPRLFEAPDASDLELRVVYEDGWIVVVDKPAGMLSVPSRSVRPEDSVLGRLRALYPDADGPLLVHRLDLDTSGLLVAARDAASHAALQRQFLRRSVEKRYVAIVDGIVSAKAGVINLALRVDVNDRPRQIVDPVYGRSAVTEWRVMGGPVGRGATANGCRAVAESSAVEGPVDREGTAPRTRIAFFPRSGRTHQLRVHASHPLGLGCPIVGDRLYGVAAGRLMLHAESLGFTHPATGERVVFESPAPF